MEKTDITRARAWLLQDPLLHMDMLEQLRMGEELLYFGEDGVLVYSAACGAYMLSCRDTDAAERITRNLSRAPLFVAHQPDAVPMLKERFGYEEGMICYQSVYLGKEPPSLPGGCEIRLLSKEYLGFVKAHYSHEGNWDAYLRDRFSANVMFGAWVGEELAGFVGLHREGSVGILEVLPAFRRLGVAFALEAFMIGRLLREDRVPFAQIETYNQASLALQKKLGCSLSQTPLCWMMGRE